MQIVPVVALGCDSFQLGTISRLIQDIQGYYCDIHVTVYIIHSESKCENHHQHLLFQLLKCLVAVVAVMHAGIGVCGAHSCARCSPVSLLCMVGIRFTGEHLSALSHRLTVSPLVAHLVI